MRQTTLLDGQKKKLTIWVFLVTNKVQFHAVDLRLKEPMRLFWHCALRNSVEIDDYDEEN